MRSITAVGFDMDYTLAQYRPETFEALAYRLTVDKLVSVCGYPALMKEFEFDWRYMVRVFWRRERERGRRERRREK